jgi:hypothetical protein
MPRIATAAMTPNRAKSGPPRQGAPAGTMTVVGIGRKPV